MENNLLTYKRILIVDDEPDVLDTLEGLLPMCDVVRASTFEQAKEILEIQYFDMAILDIMGVDGYALLKIANERGVIPVMLTAHALTTEDTVKSFKEGAAYFVPKEKIAEITTYLNEILEAKEAGKTTLHRWLSRFGQFYDRKFGPDWRDKDKDFWNKIGYI